jgi:hypothetical protein
MIAIDCDEDDYDDYCGESLDENVMNLIDLLKMNCDRYGMLAYWL